MFHQPPRFQKKARFSTNDLLGPILQEEDEIPPHDRPSVTDQEADILPADNLSGPINQEVVDPLGPNLPEATDQETVDPTPDNLSGLPDKEIDESLQIASFKLGFEPGISFGGQNYSLGQGLALGVVITVILNSDRRDGDFSLDDLPYPLEMDDVYQFGVIANLVKSDLEKTSWATPTLTSRHAGITLHCRKPDIEKGMYFHIPRLRIQ